MDTTWKMHQRKCEEGEAETSYEVTAVRQVMVTRERDGCRKGSTMWSNPQ